MTVYVEETKVTLSSRIELKDLSDVESRLELFPDVRSHAITHRPHTTRIVAVVLSLCAIKTKIQFSTRAISNLHYTSHSRKRAEARITDATTNNNVYSLY